MTDLFARLRKMKIMLIDDDEYIRDSLTMFFEGEGCRVASFETAEEALKQLEVQFYDIIIADYRLPGIDGLQFLKLIKDSHPKAMKIFVTAYGDQVVNREAVSLGVRKIVEKPFTTKTMEEALTGMISATDQKRRT